MGAGELIIILISSAIRAGTPLIFAMVGETLTERAGIINLGLEGIMLMGALTGFCITFITRNPYLGVLAALVAGALMGALHGVITIGLRGNQIVGGLALSMLGSGFSGFLGKSFIGVKTCGFSKLTVPLLSKIPFLGPMFFEHNLLVYLSYILIIISWYFLFFTSHGLILRSVGENPAAADTQGINVILIRYIYVIAGGALSGLAGAYLSLAYNQMWIENMTAGRGWIALAIVIFGGWNTLRGTAGAYLFGGIDAFQLRLQAVGTNVSATLLKTFPYLITILVLVISSSGLLKSSLHAPAALGLPYWREEKE